MMSDMELWEQMSAATLLWVKSVTDHKFSVWLYKEYAVIFKETSINQIQTDVDKKMIKEVLHSQKKRTGATHSCQTHWVAGNCDANYHGGCSFGEHILILSGDAGYFWKRFSFFFCSQHTHTHKFPPEKSKKKTLISSLKLEERVQKDVDFFSGAWLSASTDQAVICFRVSCSHPRRLNFLHLRGSSRLFWNSSTLFFWHQVSDHNLTPFFQIG